MTQLPKTIASKSLYANKYIEVKVDTLEIGGNTWEQVYFLKPHKNSAGVLPIDQTGIYLVHQYRYASKDFFWQIPMGMIDKGRTELETAKMELEEEAGLRADEFIPIGSVVAEPGMSPQETFIYVAKGLHKVQNSPSIAEIGMKVKVFPFKEIKEMIRKGEIKCGFTLSALLILKNNYFDF